MGFGHGCYKHQILNKAAEELNNLCIFYSTNDIFASLESIDIASLHYLNIVKSSTGEIIPTIDVRSRMVHHSRSIEPRSSLFVRFHEQSINRSIFLKETRANRSVIINRKLHGCQLGVIIDMPIP